MSNFEKLTDWRIDSKPPVMTKQYMFESYEKTRTFMSDLADLSEKTGYYPNLTFNQSQATVTIFTDEKELGEDEYEFAQQTDLIGELYSQQGRASHD
ncbi:4a-hydroxytetrahydrobiopterin dehydratase [uncultured Cocleimonas sp.]|uniref:4a-hydroxytetrahydrobiopterin dehydratase n=1 Tax=uncultured Cocleimonas sp. TaxID=1051587 RepID=UPI0026302C8E|nr:4a-hydroxytetrahydrobiopterin dehydratase [uncultured Cocleimonas sp.]